MQRSRDIDAFATLRAAFDDFQVGREAFADMVVVFPCARIADPCMGTTPAGIDPEDVFESKIFLEGYIQYAYCDGDETPAFVAYFCTGTASSNIVVVG